MKTVIIDDSRLARNELKRLLENHSKINIIGEAKEATEAIAQIDELKPDLIFLDIQMPGKNGFELLEALQHLPKVIFTTAYSEFALKAFEYNALDYLVKPVEPKRLAESIEKVIQQEEQKARKEEGSLLGWDDQVFVKDGERCWFVSLADIEMFEVYGNYTRVYFSQEKPLIPKTLNYLETRLDPKIFFRASRQAIINLKAIEKIDPWFSGGLKIRLKGGGEVEVSRRQAARFKVMMEF